ncbi:group II truncated hemoglobin [Chitinimonas sp. BJB300]|uniref:group II truncated hemoglobin n=1 Tax=Chitinimonas sp. BJB300 TaxID=1559339 RepID=UPI000C101CF8|nr:group II truncated hemoglobin [Chitinimonas sp. BJB300]PHV11697.1 hemoglobin-like protein [Chitinimonas sp. BJB300]TSJ88597.1 group II truncated hemoglobin [Chitinimonas sp. BJB300]
MSDIQEIAPYEQLGGELAVRQLVNRFYEIMDTDPVAAGVRAIHQPDLTEAAEKLFLFLSGWLGGPPLFVEKFGHPMLRARHLPFHIDERMRDEWLYCMYQAMDEQIGDQPALKAHLEQAFMRTADFMRNAR